jgi:hypothetical protein
VQTGAAPASPVRAQTGICHVSFVEPDEPVGRKRFCSRRRRGAPPVQASSAATSGTPGWSRNEKKAVLTVGFFDSVAIDPTKSAAVAFPNACAFRYRCTPFRKVSPPTHDSNMSRTAPPFWYVMPSNAFSMSSLDSMG